MTGAKVAAANAAAVDSDGGDDGDAKVLASLGYRQVLTRTW